MRDAIDMSVLVTGARVTWLHSPRGGYGFVVRVPAEVVRVTNNGLVRIRARLERDGIVERTVRAEHLQAREIT